MNHIIYGLIDPNTHELRYIGYTSDCKTRYYNHHYLKRLKSKSHKNNWIKSLLIKNQKAEIYILEEYKTAEELPQAEIELIEYYKSIGCDLTNGTDGGDGGLGYKHSEEAKRKISESVKGKIPKNKGIKCSQEQKDKISKTLTGKLKSIETKLKMRGNKNAFKGDKL